MKLIPEIVAFLFEALFLYASFNKILDYQKFTVQISQSPLLTGFGNLIPWIVISTEVVVSIMLFIPRFRLFGLFASFCLMTMFSAYIIAILNFSSYVPCSCGGILDELGWRDHLIFNIAFVFLSLVGIYFQLKIETESKPLSPIR